jgi:hypothetical protein
MCIEEQWIASTRIVLSCQGPQLRENQVLILGLTEKDPIRHLYGIVRSVLD